MWATDKGHRLIADELLKALGGCRMGNQLKVVEEATSTNDLVWEAEKEGAPEGYVAFAERQTAGRGQQGRQWESTPYQGLWFSVLLRPKMTMAESPQLTSILAKVVVAIVREQAGVFPQIKPPNDIYLSGRKIA